MEKQESKRRFPAFPQPRRLRTITTYGIRILRARSQSMNLLHALFTRNLLMSGVAIVRYIPRAFRVKQVDGNLFFTEEKRQEYRRRVESVTPHSPRQWG